MNIINIPKFHRQRFLLSLLESVGGSLSQAEIQKMLFLLHQKSGFSYYDFVLYNSNYHSFQAESDIKTLQNLGWFKETDEKNIILLESTYNLKGQQTEIAKFSSFIKQLPIPTDDKYRELPKSVRKNHNILFTIGYEGISFDLYANRLLKNGVRLVCDVRKNPLSRKFGFSKNIMQNLLKKIGIEYQHIAALGIISEARKNLKTKNDYSKLFLEYQASLPQQKLALKQLTNLLENNKRIAITCFEKEPQMCHRHCISDYLAKKHKVIHL